MDLDDDVCYCFHVSLRKLTHFAKRERCRHASQLSNCLGAGTGCGWCIPVLIKIHGRVQSLPECPEDQVRDILPEAVHEYAQAREAYLKDDRKHTF